MHVTQDIARISVADLAPVAGDCDLCGTEAIPAVAVVVVDHSRGGRMRLVACRQCARAARRIAAAIGSATAAVAASTLEPVGEELILVSPHRIEDADGNDYTIAVWGKSRPDETWIGWLEFTAVDDARVLRTGRETTQSTRDSLLYWATGLEPVYFQGAFHRALAQEA